MKSNITIEHIDKVAKERNFTLLSDTYIRCGEKLKFLCPEGHECSISWDSFKQGKGCRECRRLNNKKRQTLSYDYVKSQIESIDGYKLLSKEYVNNSTKLKIQCPEGHIFYMKYVSFQQGKRCNVCNTSYKLEYDYVKSQIESIDGYKLLSKEYINAKSKLKIQCPEGHIYQALFHKFKNGRRCPECYNKNRGYDQRFEYNDVKSYIESYGYKLLSGEYKNINTKLKLQCPEGHIYQASYNVFKNGHRCKICSDKKGSLKQRLKYNDVKSYIESYGYKLLSGEYKNNRVKMDIQCPEGHIFKMKYNNFQIGQRCPICNYNNISSKPEKEIQEYIRSIYNGKIINNDRNTIINPLTGWNLELDIYLPELNKAIEFNGTYWHSLDKAKIYDKIKADQCEQKNIDLLIIDENEWGNNKEKCEKIINNYVIRGIECY